MLKINAAKYDQLKLYQYIQDEDFTNIKLRISDVKLELGKAVNA